MNSHVKASVYLHFESSRGAGLCLSWVSGTRDLLSDTVGDDFPLITLGTQIALLARDTQGSSEVIPESQGNLLWWPLAGLHLAEPAPATSKECAQSKVSLHCLCPAHSESLSVPQRSLLILKLTFCMITSLWCAQGKRTAFPELW